MLGGRTKAEAIAVDRQNVENFRDTDFQSAAESRGGRSEYAEPNALPILACTQRPSQRVNEHRRRLAC